MTVATVLVVAFATDCFCAFVFLDCEQSMLTLPHCLLRFFQANPLGSDTCCGSVRPRNSLSNCLIRQTCLLHLILGRDLGSYQPTSYPHPACSGLAALSSATGTSALGSRVRPLPSDHRRWNDLLDNCSSRRHPLNMFVADTLCDT